MAKGITKAELERVAKIAKETKPKRLPKLFEKDDFGRNRGQVLQQWKVEICDRANVSMGRAGTAIHTVISEHGDTSW